MSKKEIESALQACKLFVNEYEIDGKREKTGRCRKFFEVIKHVRLFLQITTELLKRIENLETEINNLKIK